MTIKKSMIRYSALMGALSVLLLVFGIASGMNTAGAVAAALLITAGIIAAKRFDEKVEKEMIRLFGEEKFYTVEAFATYWVMGILFMLAFFIVFTLFLLKHRII